MDSSIEIWNRQKAEELLDNPESLAENLETLMNSAAHES
jgi:hypothetical protein